MGGCNKKSRREYNNIDDSVLIDDKNNKIKYNFDEYFDMINKKVTKFYKENQNNQFNISISLDRKDFITSSIPKRVSVNTYEKYVYWKDYLLDYLYKQQETEEWMKELINDIENEIFLKENKWLSLFFWQEFELKTKPKTLYNDTTLAEASIPTNILDDTNADADADADANQVEIEKISEKIRLHSNISERFYSQKPEGQSMNEDDENQINLYKDYRKKVKSYIQIFNQHVSNPEHPFNIIIRLYVKSFSKYISNVIEEIKDFQLKNQFSINDSSIDESTNSNFIKMRKIENNNCNWDKTEGSHNISIITNGNDNQQKSVTNEKITFSSFVHERHVKVVKGLQKMTLKLQTSLRLMYAKTINYQCFIEEKDEFINLICNTIFKTGDLYELIYELFSLTLLFDIEDFKKKLKLFQNVNPEDLSIKPQFCLNHNTISLQNELMNGNKRESVREIKSKIQKGNNDSSIKDDNKDMSIMFNFSHEKIMTIYNKTIDKKDSIDLESYIPYSKPINSLKNIALLKLPLEKILLIANLSIGITNSVNSFWNNLQFSFDNSLLDINADELMAIFIYIIMKSQLYTLVIHAVIIKEFTTAVTKNSMMGYYYTTLEAAIIFIRNLKSFDDLNNLKEVG